MAEATIHADSISRSACAPTFPTHSRYLHDDASHLAVSAGMASLDRDTQRIGDSHHPYTHVVPPAARVVPAGLTFSDPSVANPSETGAALPSTPMDPFLSVHETAQFLPGHQLESNTVETRKTRRSPGVNSACTNCRADHKRCSDGHPCTRCLQHGVQDTCIRRARKTRLPPRAGCTSYSPFSHPVAAAAIPSPGFSYPPSWPTGLASMNPYIQPCHGLGDVLNTFTAEGFGGAYPPMHGVAGHDLVWQPILVPAANGVWNHGPPCISGPHQGFAGEHPYDTNTNGMTMAAAFHEVTPHLLSSFNNTSYNEDHTSSRESDVLSQPLPSSSTSTAYNHGQYGSNGGEELNDRFYGLNLQ